MEPQGQEPAQQALPQASELEPEPEQAQRGSPLASELPQQELQQEPEPQALPQAPWEPPLFSPQQVLRPSFPQVPEPRRRKLRTSMQRQSPPKVR